jgi:hypothetical protein
MKVAGDSATQYEKSEECYNSVLPKSKNRAFE